MKIATWNVAYARGKASNEKRRNVLEKVNADVWVFTETHADLTPGPGYCKFLSAARFGEVFRCQRFTSWNSKDRVAARTDKLADQLISLPAAMFRKSDRIVNRDSRHVGTTLMMHSIVGVK